MAIRGIRSAAAWWPGGVWVKGREKVKLKSYAREWSFRDRRESEVAEYGQSGCEAL